jgi:carbon-monoxide dehydrogenase medium subunit
VKPAQFEYHAPTSVAEAVALLGRYGGEARPLAGGQSLVPMMNFRVVAPPAIVDLNRIPELAYVQADDGRLRIGAMTRQRRLEFDPLVAERLPLLRQALRLIGHLPTRSRGTIGGSIAHADPSAEIPMVLTVLDGEITARGPNGERQIAARDLFESALTTSLAADELLTEVRLPAIAPGTLCAIEEFSRRHGDFAIAAIACVIERDGDKCRSARLATAGVGSVPVRLKEAEAILEKDGLGEAAIKAAAAKAAEIVDPITDHNASADYRRHLAGVLTRRAIEKALKGGDDARRH